MERQNVDVGPNSITRQATNTTSLSTKSTSSALASPTSSVPVTVGAESSVPARSPSLSSSDTESSGQALVTKATFPSTSWSTVTLFESSTSSPTISTTRHPFAQTAGPDGLPQQPGLSVLTSSKQILITTTIIGGIFIFTLLICALHRRRKGAKMSEIVRFRRRPPSTIMDPSHLDSRLTALPIWHTFRYSVHSSKHASRVNLPASTHMESAMVAPPMPERFLTQHVYVPTRMSLEPLRGTKKDKQVSNATSPPPPPPPKEPGKAHSSTRSFSSSRMNRNLSDDTTKSGFAVLLSKGTSSDPSPGTPPDSPHSLQQLQGPDDRWSWTNSQAPATPRMYAPSIRNSRASLPRFRTVRSWIELQSDYPDLPDAVFRGDDGNVTALPTLKSALKKRPSKLTVEPRKLSKRGRTGQGSLKGSLFKSGSIRGLSTRKPRAVPKKEVDPGSPPTLLP